MTVRALPCYATALLLGAALPAAASARPKLPPCPPPHAQLFLSPMGEPFRAPAGVAYPVAAWFAQADTDHDGRLSLAEMLADADRFFRLLDTDRDGELIPAEVSHYEREIAPEIQLYARRSTPFGTGAKAEMRQEKRKRAKDDGSYGGPLGAGRYAFLNIPEPVLAADADMNRAVDAAEFRAAAKARFLQLDTAGAGYLTLAALPRTPADPAAVPCVAAPSTPPAKRSTR